MKREVIQLEIEDLKNIACNNSESFELIETIITGVFKQGNENTAVFRRLSDGKYFEISYKYSIKEPIDFEDMNNGNIVAIEVFKEEKTIIVYE